jgi:hypothetical protein
MEDGRRKSIEIVFEYHESSAAEPVAISVAQVWPEVRAMDDINEQFQYSRPGMCLTFGHENGAPAQAHKAHANMLQPYQSKSRRSAVGLRAASTKRSGRANFQTSHACRSGGPDAAAVQLDSLSSHTRQLGAATQLAI